MGSRARGFTLLETVLSVAIAVVLAWLLFHMLSQVLLASRLQMQRDAEQATVGQLVDALTSEEDDAWAIYNPPSDVTGKSNADGHEVDFYTRDGRQRTYFWAYDYDAASKTVVRYRFASPGATPAKDVTYGGITKFVSHTYPVTALQDPSTPVYSALYNGASLRSGVVRFYPSGMPWIQGGNNITYVDVEGATTKNELQLVTQTAPTGFTVVLWYTPSPVPQPTSTFKTWPAVLVVRPSNAAVGTTSGTLAYVTPKQWIAKTLNSLLGGGIAMAAQSCTALAMNASGSSPDASIDGTPAQTALGVHVDSNGCEVDASDNPLAQPVVVAWEPGGNSETFTVNSNGTTCGSSGSAASIGPWATNNTAAYVDLDATGSSVGSCSVTLSDSVSTQTPSPDNGSATVNVLGCPLDSYKFCSVAGSVVNGTLDTCATNGGNPPFAHLHYYDSVSTPYRVYAPSGAVYNDTKTITYPTGGTATYNRWCPPTASQGTTSWSPGEPKTQTGDPNLP